MALLSGCATHPLTGRDQIIVLPAVQALHADVSFAVATAANGAVPSPACEQPCSGAGDIAGFSARVAAIGARFEVSARAIAPETFERIAGFQIEVNDAMGVSTGSSAGGRVVLGAGLARLAPTDGVISFLIAREMAHVIARHAEENSGASIAFSVLGILFPGFNLIAKAIASKVGSSMLTGSWEAQQQREADEIAVALLEHSGLSAKIIALELDAGLANDRLPADAWGASYLASTRRVALIAASPPRYAEVIDLIRAAETR